MKNLILLFFLMTCVITYSQSHKYLNTIVIRKNFNTNVEEKMKDYNGITISNLGNGKFKLKDKFHNIVFKFVKIDSDKVYLYKIISGENYFDRISSGVDMKKIANGLKGSFAIDSEKSAEVWIYKLQK